jgi:enamine deaminase RidA (YjgF/YER057c/UK114 family)
MTSLVAPHGEIYFANDVEKNLLYGEWHFASARRVGPFVLLSGVVVAPRKGEATDIEGFKGQLRRGFSAIEASLKEAGLTFADVVAFDTFHVFKSSYFSGSKTDHLTAFRVVKDEFVKPPYPTWTAIGVDSLVTDQGLVEIKATAYAPK